MAGNKEHEGNRNYFGPEGIAHARESRIHAALSAIARLRRDTPALQRGLQVNLELRGDRAAFLRVLKRGKTAQTALVLLNKGDAPATFSVDRYLEAGAWRDGTDGQAGKVLKGKALVAEVPAHGVRVLLRDGRTKDAALVAELDRAAAALAAF
jgi:cyclomaltodextrin glucanotransferase